MSTNRVHLPRVPRRARGLSRYAGLLDAVDALLHDREPGDLTIQDVAAQAGVPLASVYHYFPSNLALVAGLAQRYLEEIEACLNEPFDHGELQFWTDIVRIQSGRVWRYFVDRPVATKLLYGGDGMSMVRSLDMEANERIARRHITVYRRHFVLPDDESLVDRCIIALTVADSVGSLSYGRYGKVTKEMAEQAVVARIAYLKLFMPEHAPKRQKPLP